MHRGMSQNLIRRFTLSFTAATLLAGGCAPPEEEIVDEEVFDEKADAITADEDPRLLIARASRRLSTTIRPSDVGQTFGTPDGSVPYPDTYWPFSDPNNEGANHEAIVNAIDHRWGGAAQSPLEKYMTMVNPAGLAAAKAWNLANHGKDVSNVEPWFGLCNGWTAASLKEKPVTRPVDAKLVAGKVVACAAGSEGCTRFEIGDINGLLAEAYLDGDSDFLGARCDTKPADIKRDQDGRVINEGCQGTNAGTLMIVANKFMRQLKRGFAVNAQEPNTTNEIWNQPAYRYNVTHYSALTESEAAKLVSNNRIEDYAAFNTEAKGWVRVQATFSWITENGPNKEYVDGTASTKRTQFDMILELDRAVTDVNKPGYANIVGGEYLQTASVGSHRLENFPYLWVPKGAGPERASGSGNSHNPSLSPLKIRALAALGR
jgi:hypothetical protein